MFKHLINKNIFINLKKAFIKYLLMELLGQKVDSFRLIIAEAKLKAIIKLTFPRTLADLKLYINLIG